MGDPPGDRSIPRKEPNDGTAVGDAIRAYLDAAPLAPTTCAVYRSTLTRFALVVGLDKAVSDLTPADIDEFLAGYQNYAASTFNANLVVLRSFVAWCVARGLIKHNIS